jgi:TrbL/VirB6 plasmid conjugal transfer protein
VRRRWSSRLTLAALLAGWLLAGTAALVGADSGTPAPRPGPPPPQGIESLVPAPPGIQQGNQPTLAERYSALAYTTFSVSLGDTIKDAALNPMQATNNLLYSAWAGLVMSLLLVVAILTTRLLEWVFSMDIVSGAGGPLGEVVRQLSQQVYAPLLSTALVLVGVWLLWQLLLRRRPLAGLQGVAWVLGALVAAGVYFAAPVQVMSGVDGFTADLSRAVLGAVGNGDPGMARRGSNPSFAQGDASDAELRMFVDRYWRTFVFTPWSTAELGDPQAGQRYGEELLAKQDNRPSNFDSDFEATASQDTKNWYGGQQGGWRLVMVCIALVIALAASVLFLLVGGGVLMSQFALLALLMLAPLFLLAGIHPGVGRRLLTRWAELVAAALLLRVFSAALLAVMLVLSGLAAAVTANGPAGWALQAALQLALVSCAFVFRKPFLRIFGQLAAPRLIASHVGHPLPAQKLHDLLEWRTRALVRSRPATASGAAASGGAGGGSAGATAVGRAAAPRAAAATGLRARLAARMTGPGLALTALEAGKLGVRTAARASRTMQDFATPFVVTGGGVRPPSPRFVRSAAPRLSASSNGAGGSQPRPDRRRDEQRQGEPADQRRGRERRERAPAGRTYTHWRTGESVTVRSSKIVLPGSWRRERRP